MSVINAAPTSKLGSWPAAALRRTCQLALFVMLLAPDEPPTVDMFSENATAIFFSPRGRRSPGRIGWLSTRNVGTSGGVRSAPWYTVVTIGELSSNGTVQRPPLVYSPTPEVPARAK